MDTETGVALVGGAMAGGGLLTWFVRTMLDRLLKQIDKLIRDMQSLTERTVRLEERSKAAWDRIERLLEDQVRIEERLVQVGRRTDSLSTNYGPRLQILEADMHRREGT